MKEIICILIAVGLFSLNAIHIHCDAGEQMQQEIIKVETDTLMATNQITTQNVIETKIKTEDDIKEEKRIEFYQKQDIIKQIEDNEERFLRYKELNFEYAEWIDLKETIFDVFSEEEIYLMYRVVETECYQQDFDSKVNVANVILNRYYDGRFGDTITDVITSPKQFAYGRKNIEEDTMLAVQYAYEFDDTTQGSLYFHSNKKTDTFNGASFVFQDEAGHNFYKPNVYN